MAEHQKNQQQGNQGGNQSMPGQGMSEEQNTGNTGQEQGGQRGNTSSQNDDSSLREQGAESEAGNMGNHGGNS